MRGCERHAGLNAATNHNSWLSNIVPLNAEQSPPVTAKVCVPHRLITYLSYDRVGRNMDAVNQGTNTWHGDYHDAEINTSCSVDSKWLLELGYLEWALPGAW